MYPKVHIPTNNHQRLIKYETFTCRIADFQSKRKHLTQVWARLLAQNRKKQNLASGWALHSEVEEGVGQVAPGAAEVPGGEGAVADG